MAVIVSKTELPPLSPVVGCAVVDPAPPSPTVIA